MIMDRHDMMARQGDGRRTAAPMNGNIFMTSAPQTSVDYVVRMEGICKSFSGVPVLRDVNLDVAAGEVHALMGENGAGKSTLMKILCGIHQKDDGAIYLNGQPVHIRSPKESLRLGISMIHQELNPVRAMTVAENIFLGREPCRGFTPIVNTRRQRELTASLFQELGASLNPDARMSSLSVAQMQLVEIVKAVSCSAGVIIMDEPTSAIAGREVEKLFAIIRNLKSRGISIIYISHRLDEIFRISDTITVLRDGRFIASRPAAAVDEAAVVRMMVGREIRELFPKAGSVVGDISVEVDGLTRRGKFRNIRFNARRGEVLGFGGLIGAGRSEVMETIFGIHRADAGAIRIHGRPVHIRSPSDAIRHGLALVTEDRQRTGLNLKASVKANMTLVSLKKFCRARQVLRLGEERRAVDSQLQSLAVKARDQNQVVSTLSGGNQQKIVLAKWLLTNPQIIILDEPTRGIDIGAKAEFYEIIRTLARQGRTVILVSSEMPELLGLCDRIIVLYQGKIAAEFKRGSFDQEEIIRAAIGQRGES